MPKISLDYLLKTLTDLIKESDFSYKKRRIKRYPAETMTDEDNVDDLAFLANTSV